MLKLYRTNNEQVHEKLKSLLPADSEIKRTENGKPYTDGACFSITHTGDTALIAISDCPIGIDAEILQKRKFSSVLKNFSSREQSEIGENNIEFLKHWVVKEAYIKLIGGTLAHDLKRLEYHGGQLYYNGIKANCNILCTCLDNLIYCVCAQSDIPENLKTEIIYRYARAV